MRLKLVLISSLVAAFVGAAIPVVIVVFTLGSFSRSLDPALSRHANGWLEFTQLAPPLVTAFLASMFVYRHTARRRKFQAVLTIILVLLLSLATHVALLLLNL